MLKRLSSVIILLVVTWMYVEIIPVGKGTSLKKDISLFPVRIGDWIQIEGSRKLEFNPIFPNEVLISGRYKNDKGEEVVLYLGYWGKFRYGKNIFAGKNIAPGKNWNSKYKAYKLINIGGDPIAINEIRFKKGNDDMLMSYLLFMGDIGIIKKGPGRLNHAKNAILNQRTDVALVKVSSLFYQQDDTERHQAIHKRFIEEVFPILMEFLPYEL